MTAERNIEAEEAYRALWHRHQNSIALERARCEDAMDELQGQIADGPRDPRWTAFTETLPGFHEYWARILDHIMRQR